jgi:hypothetical protein
MFGLPLLSSFYPVVYSPGSDIELLIPYILISIIIGLYILSRRSSSKGGDLQLEDRTSQARGGVGTYKLGYASLFFATLAIPSYWLMRYFVDRAYPAPAGDYASIAALAYLATISLTTLFGVPFLLKLVFPALRDALSFRSNFTKVAVTIGAAYFVTYLLLVNQIVITGFNAPPSNFIPSPSGTYPFVFPFTSGPSPSSGLESAFYVPQITIQLSPYVNLLVMPFEMILAIALSCLVASSIMITYFLIKKSSKHSCLTGATVSGLGGFFGFTATCPMCLVPTLVSVFLGGVSGLRGISAVVPSFYSHLSGVVIPPLFSVVALLAGIAYLNFRTYHDSSHLEVPFAPLSKRLSK